MGTEDLKNLLCPVLLIGVRQTLSDLCFKDAIERRLRRPAEFLKAAGEHYLPDRVLGRNCSQSRTSQRHRICRTAERRGA